MAIIWRTIVHKGYKVIPLAPNDVYSEFVIEDIDGSRFQKKYTTVRGAQKFIDRRQKQLGE